jgi:hypothetical protein
VSGAAAKRNHVSVRLEPEILDRVEALIPRFSTSTHVGTRSDVMRALILGALERGEGAESAELPDVDSARPEEAAKPAF